MDSDHNFKILSIFGIGNIDLESRMKAFIIAIFMSLSGLVFADDASSFCNDVELIRKNTPDNVFKSVSSKLNIILNPSSVMEVNDLNTTLQIEEVNGLDSHIFINLTKADDFKAFPNLKNKVKQFKKDKRHFRSNKLYIAHYEIKSFQGCTDLARVRQSEFNVLFELYKRVQAGMIYSNIETRIKTKKFALKQLSKLKKNGWIIHKDLTLEGLSNVLASKPKNILIITHSFSNGSIVDSENKIIPPSIFSNTPESLGNLSIVSCYSQKVMKLFNISHLVEKGRFNFKYMTVREKAEKHFGEGTPLFGLKLMSKVLKKDIKRNDVVSSKNCSIEFDRTDSDSRIGIFLNNQFVSPLNNKKILVYCDLLGEKNTLTLTRMNADNSINTSFIPQSVTITSNSEITSKTIKHYSVNGLYQSSKTK